MASEIKNQIYSIGSTLKSLRIDEGFTRKTIAERTGIGISLLSRIESGTQLLSLDQLYLLADAYGEPRQPLYKQWLHDKALSESPLEKGETTASKLADDSFPYGKQAALPLIGDVPERRPIKEFLNKVIQGDCLQVMQGIPDKSIDMILCDLPYGTTQNKWDSVIDLQRLWAEYERIIKDRGAIVLTAQGLFTAKLILSNEKLFKYKIVWIKSKATNFLNAKVQPLRKHEDICVFYKEQPTYHPQMTEGEPYDKGIRKDQYTGSYGDFKPRHVKSATGSRYPTDVLEMELNQWDGDALFYRVGDREVQLDCVDEAIYVKTAESEGKVLHPTQKPVRLGRWLVRTFTNPGEVVLDNTCGSGSFLVGALLEKRYFIGIEKNEDVLLHKKEAVDYVEICNERLKQAETTLESQIEFESTKLARLDGRKTK